MRTNSSNSCRMMSLFRRFFTILAVIVILPIQTARAEVSAADLYEMMSPSVVRIFQLDDEGNITSQGSGFFIEGGLVATNHHVVDVKDAKYIVETYGGKVIPVVGILGEDRANDLAILLVGSNREQPILLRPHEKLRIGSNVYVLGSPLGLQNTISDGLLSGIREHDGKTQLQLTAPISPGSSGGPVFNEEAELIGVVVSLIEDGQNINFAIPLDVLNSLIASISNRTPTEANTFTRIEDLDKKAFINLRVVKLLAEARFQAKAKDNRTQAFRMIAAAMRLDPESKDPPHVMRSLLKEGEYTYAEFAGTNNNNSNSTAILNHIDSVLPDASLSTSGPFDTLNSLQVVLPNIEVTIIDIAIGVRSHPGGLTEILFDGYEIPRLADKILIDSRSSDRTAKDVLERTGYNTAEFSSSVDRTAKGVLERMGYTAELSSSITRNFPSDPESYLSGQIILIKGNPRIMSLGYYTGKARVGTNAKGMVVRCVIENVSAIEVLSQE